MRAEYQIHIRRSFQDLFPLLLGHTPADCNNQVGSRLLEAGNPPQVTEDLLNGFFPYCTGVDDKYIRLIG